MRHIEKLISESVHIIREVVSETKNPVMLYSIGKDSGVMLDLALKAFYPGKIPFKLLHIDTGWKFKEMYLFRDQIIKKYGIDLIIYKNLVGAKKVSPFDKNYENYTDIMKTEALKKALTKGKFDAAICGARRDEEKSRSKERIFSYRSENYQWNPKNQRPEMWDLYNTYLQNNETIRVFPLSNWTELDIWKYIYIEKLKVVPLYFSKKRPFVNRNGNMIMVNDKRFQFLNNEKIIWDDLRFRTLGCYPLTAGIRSNSKNVEEIIQELLSDKKSERSGRLIDHNDQYSMENKKVDGYF